MRQKVDSKTSLSGEESYRSYLESIPARDKAILYTMLSRLEKEGEAALEYLKVVNLEDGRISISKSRWKIFGYICGKRFELETVEDIRYK